MNEVLMTFLSLTLSGSLVALLFFLLKLLFKDRLGKTWQYYIIMVVILRFLVPVAPETGPVGMIFAQAARSNIPNSHALIIPEPNYVPTEASAETLPIRESNTNNPSLINNALQPAIDLLWLGWLVPAAFLLLRKIIGYHRSVRSVKAGCIKIEDTHVLDIYHDVCASMKIKVSPALAQNENVSAPMLAGIVRPVIILPDLHLKDNEIRYVLQHELTHYRRLDIICKWLAQIVVCVHWYNPLVYRICREANHICELSCDEVVIMCLDETERYAYGDMLLETIKPQRKSLPPVVPVMLNEDKKLIKERLIAIMNFRKVSKKSKIASLALSVLFLCAAIYTGAYAQSNGNPAATISEINDITVSEIPVSIEFDNVPASKKLQFGPYELNTDTAYTLIIGWQGGGDTLELFLTGADGSQEEYTLSNAESINISVPKDGLYYFYAPRNRETGDMSALSISFNTSNALNTQSVIYESIDLRRYEQSGGSIPAHPYVHEAKSNHTDKKIIGHQRGMLAFDKTGNPLKIDWFSLDSDSDSAYYFLYDWDTTKILPGETHDEFGGWSLNVYGTDLAVNEIAYVLYCDKEITFEDGTVWRNPDFDNWRKTYEGKPAEPDVLESYYPYVQKIAF